MRMDHETLMAAMLHDVIEDTQIAKSHIKKEFGGGVAQIVDGLSKLTQIEFETHAEAQASNFQKMLMAMANDIRVILVKLADRLHNMRTIEHLELQKQKLGKDFDLKTFHNEFLSYGSAPVKYIRGLMDK